MLRFIGMVLVAIVMTACSPLPPIEQAERTGHRVSSPFPWSLKSPRSPNPSTGRSQGLGWRGDAFSSEEIDKCRLWLEAKSISIAGGSNEIQLNIIAKRVLGLPD